MGPGKVVHSSGTEARTTVSAMIRVFQDRFLPRERLVADAVRLIGVDAEPLLALGLVGLVVPLAPDDLALPLEREDVGHDAVEEPAVVADDHGAAAEIQQRLLEGPE